MAESATLSYQNGKGLFFVVTNRRILMTYRTVKEVKGVYRLSWEKESDDGSISLLRERWTGDGYDFEDVVAIKTADLTFIDAFIVLAKKLDIGTIESSLRTGCGERVFFAELTKDQLSLTVELDADFDCRIGLSLQDWDEIKDALDFALWQIPD
jgi:hypothetical protein